MIFDKTLWQPNDRKKEEPLPRGEGVHLANYLLGKPFSFLDVLMRLVSAAVHSTHRIITGSIFSEATLRPGVDPSLVLGLSLAPVTVTLDDPI